MSPLLCLPSPLHIGILVQLVAGCFDELIDDGSLLDGFGDLYGRFDALMDFAPDPKEDGKRHIIADTTLVFATMADITLAPYLAACSVARLCWRSYRRTIFRRAAAECLQALEPRVKAIRRGMMRAWFRRAVWRAVNPDNHGFNINGNIRAREAWENFEESALKFWDLDYKASALRSMVSDHVLLDQLSDLSKEVVQELSRWRPRLPTRRVRPSTKSVSIPS
jgi:hypothetical protein